MLRVVFDYLVCAIILLSALVSLVLTVWAFKRGAIVLGVLFLACTTLAFHWLWRAWRALLKTD